MAMVTNCSRIVAGLLESRSHASLDFRKEARLILRVRDRFSRILCQATGLIRNLTFGPPFRGRNPNVVCGRDRSCEVLGAAQRYQA